MKWETTIWLIAALGVTTSALHLTIEQNLQNKSDDNVEDTKPTEGVSTTTPSGIKIGANNDVVQLVDTSDEQIESRESSGESEVVSNEQSSQTNSNEQTASSSQSNEKTSRSNEIDSVNVEPGNPDDNGNSGAGDGSVDDTEGEGNVEAEGGGNNEANGEGNGDTGGGGNGDTDSGGNGESDNGGNGESDGGSNGESDGGGDGDTDGGGNGESDGGGNGGTDSGGNGGTDGGGNGESDGGGNGGGNGDSEPEDGAAEDDVTLVQTTSGPVRGHVWRENDDIISYIDITYGTFANIFEAPVPPEVSENVHDVKEHSKRCPQLQDDLYVGDIDCLTLSIFKPQNAATASVLVHIHEGNFVQGSANPALYGPEYLVSKGIILVLPNYRLGPLGFLCLQNEIAPGNAALKDLTLALSWVKSNIAAFGGDPENIAVSADGTAGALAGYLALSPISKHYISKVITESGSVLSHWAFDRNPITTAMNLEENINDFQSWEEVELSKLVTAAKEVALRPCLEENTEDKENFMVETPWKMLENQEINITFMIGSAMYAGAHHFSQLSGSSVQELNDDIGLLLPNDLRFETNEEKNTIGMKVKTLYFGETAISLSDMERLTLYFTDAAYLGPGIRTARPLVDSGATVYFYEFSFVGDFNRELKAIDLPVQGAVRGDIIGYLFTQDGMVPGEDTREKRMVDQLTELWTSFLTTGTPSAVNIAWNKLESGEDSEEEWLSIDADTSLRKGLHVDRLSLWTDIYNQHFIERNLAFGPSSSVYTVLVAQLIFWLSFFRNVSHLC